MGIVQGSVKRVNEADISRAPKAERDIYIPATDHLGKPLGYGRVLVARAGQPIPERYRKHPAVTGAIAAPAPKIDARAATVVPPADRSAAVSTLTKPDLLDELEGYGFEHDGQTVPELREILKASREAGELVMPGGDDEDAVTDDDGAGDEEE